jgi:DNA-binding YbaB/EbfC family protein
VLKGLGNLKDILGQAKHLQKDLKEFQDKAAAMRVNADVGAGMVTVVATGDQKIVDIKINRELFDPRDLDMLEELIISGVNEALNKSREAVAEQMKQFSKKANLPEDFEQQLRDSLGIDPDPNEPNKPGQSGGSGSVS